MVQNKGTIQLSELRIGDPVLVGRGKYEPVYSFGHSDAIRSSEYIKLTTTAPRNSSSTSSSSSSFVTSVELSPPHMIFTTQKGVIPASLIQVGDELMLLDGTISVVTMMELVTRVGAYAPFTPSGQLMVDGVLVSCYIALQESALLTIGPILIPVSHHSIAYAFESVHRMAHRLGLLSTLRETYDSNGMSHWVAQPFKIGLWLMEPDNAVLLACSITPLILVFGTISLLESVLIATTVHPITLVIGWLTFLAVRRTTRMRSKKSMN